MFAEDAKADGDVMYRSENSALTGNVDSVGFEAKADKELGERIKFVHGTGGMVRSVTVVMSSWGVSYGTWYGGD